MIKLNKIPCDNNTPNECLFEVNDNMTTLVAYVRLYDREGREASVNPNMVTASVHCRKCGGTWTVTQRGDYVESITKIT
jgi:hypothetical protein